jgi:hypothetical protein
MPTGVIGTECVNKLSFIFIMLKFDRENEEFLGFDLDNIEEAEERYIRQ